MVSTARIAIHRQRDGLEDIIIPEEGKAWKRWFEEVVQEYLTMILDDCPIWGESIATFHTEKISVEKAETLDDPELIEFYAAKNAGISIVNVISDQGEDCWIATIWLEVDDIWFLMDVGWFDSLDAIAIQLRQ